MVIPRSERKVAENSAEDTYWHELADDDIGQKLDQLNRRLQDTGYRTRFRVIRDEFGWDVILDDGGELELVETIEDAEKIVRELCGVAADVNRNSEGRC